MRQLGLHELRQRHVGGRRHGVRRADAEDEADEMRVVLRNAVDDRTAPVVAAEDDPIASFVSRFNAVLADERRHVVRDRLVRVRGEGQRRIGAAVSETVGGEDGEAEREEERDLVSPAHAQVGEAVDEEDGAAAGALGGGGVEVAWRMV